MSMTVPLSKAECSGCTACVAVCPVKAITLIKDEEGFAYPSVNKELCIECGLCAKSCSFAHNKKIEASMKNVYVGKHQNLEVRMNSRSGAVFVALSDWILEMGGVVYGCILNERWIAVHSRAVSKTERDAMCKSKYVQSDMNGIIPLIENDLRCGRYVLFTGTGCQVEGVLAALHTKKVNCNKLYAVDIVCHGVASPVIFEEYITWLEKKYKGVITDFQFRDKEACGWDGHVESYVIKGRKHYATTYREIFHTDLCLRPSCYHCKNCTVTRVSDLTIADAWGIKQALPDFNDNRGVSMFLVQSEKGRQLLEKISDVCEIAELPLPQMMQYNMQYPSKPHGDRLAFWKIYKEKGFQGLVERYGTIPFWKKLKEKGKYQVRRVVQSSKYYLP